MWLGVRNAAPKLTHSLTRHNTNHYHRRQQQQQHDNGEAISTPSMPASMTREDCCSLALLFPFLALVLLTVNCGSSPPGSQPGGKLSLFLHASPTAAALLPASSRSIWMQRRTMKHHFLFCHFAKQRSLIFCCCCCCCCFCWFEGSVILLRVKVAVTTATAAASASDHDAWSQCVMNYYKCHRQ